MAKKLFFKMNPNLDEDLKRAMKELENEPVEEEIEEEESYINETCIVEQEHKRAEMKWVMVSHPYRDNAYFVCYAVYNKDHTFKGFSLPLPQGYDPIDLTMLKRKSWMGKREAQRLYRKYSKTE